MTVREFLQSKGDNKSFTFVIGHAVKDSNTPFYHMEYRETPIHTAHEWLRDEWGDALIVVNPDHPPIDTTGNWNSEYNHKRLACAMLTTETDLITMYGEGQGASMVRYYDKLVRNQ